MGSGVGDAGDAGSLGLALSCNNKRAWNPLNDPKRKHEKGELSGKQMREVSKEGAGVAPTESLSRELLDD